MSQRCLGKLILSAIGAALCGVAIASGFPLSYNAQTGREALQASRQSGKPVMVYFSQANCIWCSRVEALLVTSAYRATLVESYNFVDVDIRRTDRATIALMQLFKVRATPAFAFLSPKGEPICMVYGYIRNTEELRSINATVQALATGGAPTESTRGFPSCRGKATTSDDLVTEIRK